MPSLFKLVFSSSFLFSVAIMDSFVVLVLFVALLPLFLFFLKSSSSSKRLPPGSLGLPLIGQSIAFLHAMWANKGEEWIAKRIEKYGPVSKLSLFGSSAILLTGPAANKLIFTSNALVPQNPESLPRIIGRKNMVELAGEEHKRVRGAVSQFLRPEELKKYVGRIDKEVKKHLEENWIGRETVSVMPLAKSLTFDIICMLMFGIEEGPIRNRLKVDFTDLLIGVWSVPVNLPFTNFNKSLKASQRVRKVLGGIVKERRTAIEQGIHYNSHEDLISYLISLGNKDIGSLSDEEIVDNAVLIMLAGYDTSSILITFMIRQLAKSPSILDAMVQEQEAIAKSKPEGESLTWEDLSKMKFTWRVAMETLRMVPPVFGSFRRALKDIEFNGYLIPKGWLVFWTSNITHMDERIFQDPSKFDPTRFENQSSIPPYCFIAFGGGARICPGSELSRVETLVMMHYVVTLFNWKLCGKADTYKRDPLPSPLVGLPIKLEMKTSVKACQLS